MLMETDVLWLVKRFAEGKNCVKLCTGTPEGKLIQYTLDLRKPNLRKNLDLRKIVGATDFLVHKMFDLRKIF